MFSETETRKRNIIYIRALLSLVITLLGVYKFNYIMESAGYVAYFITVLIASNFVFIVLPARYFEGMRMHYIIFILDIVFVSLGAYWLASFDFLFFMVIFVTIFISAIGQSVGLSVVVSIVVNVFYFFIKNMIQQSGGAEAATDSLLLNIPFIFMVALHSSYMAEKAGEDIEGVNRLKKSNQALTGRVNEISAEISDYMEYSDRVLDSMREGIIVLDTHGVIKQFNKKSENIFGLKRNKVVNFIYREIKDLGDVMKIIAEIIQKHQVTYEKEISISIGGEIKRITVNTGYINDKADNIIGYVCTVRQKITGTVEGV